MFSLTMNVRQAKLSQRWAKTWSTPSTTATTLKTCLMAVDLAAAAHDLRAARAHLQQTMTDAQKAAITAHASGTPETEIARTLGINRMTVRKWLGK